MYELTTCIAAAIDADVANLYLVEEEGQLSVFPHSSGSGWVTGSHKILDYNLSPFRPDVQEIQAGTSVAAFCAYAKDVVGT